MAVTLEWIRDNYDANGNRYIDEAEINVAYNDYPNKINMEQMFAIIDAYDNHTLLPAYDTPPANNVPLEWIRDNYDANGNRYIDEAEANAASNDYPNKITMEQLFAVIDAKNNHTLLPAYDVSPAKGSIVNVSYPSNATNNETIQIRAATQNTGGERGTFMLELYLSGGQSRISYSSSQSIPAESTGSLQTMSVTMPNTGTSVVYMLKCIRMT